MSNKKVKVSTLLPDDQNFNVGNEFGESLIEKSFAKFGAGRSILLDKHNRIIAGNKSTQKFVEQGGQDVVIVETSGDTLVAVKRTDIDLDTKRGREMALADNAAAKSNITWDAEKIFAWEMPAAEWGIDLEQPETEGEADAEPQIDKAAELNEKWKVKTGDLWQIGERRLVCGDSCSPRDVSRLMGYSRASLFATDPPYVVGYVGGSHPSTKSNQGKANKDKDWSEHYNEASSHDDGYPFYDAFVKTALEHAVLPSAAWYCWHASKRQAMLENVWTANGILTHQQIIWLKSRPVLTYSVYMWQHEPCLFGWIQGNKPPTKTKFVGKYPTTIWDIPNSEIESADHPTSKPMKLFTVPMEIHTQKGDVCYEPFAGSGSQYVAAENLARKCYGLELDEGFCAVILERMSNAFPNIEIKRIEQAEAAKT